MIAAGTLPIPIVFLLRRYQCLKMDINIHEGSIRRIDTTVSTKEMITDVDVSKNLIKINLEFKNLWQNCKFNFQLIIRNSGIQNKMLMIISLNLHLNSW